MHIRDLCALVLIATAPALAADKHGHAHNHGHGHGHGADHGHGHGHRAHHHGVADLEAVLEGNELHLRLAGPADNVLGFEHAPRTDAQKQTVQRAEQLLNQPQRLITLPAAAGCVAQPARVEIKLPPPDSREQHADFEAEYRWRCAMPAALRHIDVGLFKAFAHMNELRAQVVTGSGQDSARLNRNATRLTLRP